ncbi:MAG: flagellar hook protein FlgE, partial [Candidatus Sedimenticola endophacoides]
TSNNLDLAINGEGFFILGDDQGSRYYTRSGAFGVDREGYIVNHAGQRLQVYDAVAGSGGTTTFDTGALVDMQLELQPSPPNATTEISAGINLNAALDLPTSATFSIADPNSYNSATSITVYDSLGEAHTATLYFGKTSTANQWNVRMAVAVNDTTTTVVGPETVTFDSAGALSLPASGILSFSPYAFTNGAANMSVDVDFNTATQYAGEFGVNDLSQDGYASGRLNGIDVDDTGVVFARFTNGRSTSLGKVVLAKFNNPDGLGQEGGNNWNETFDSGDAQLGEAGTASFGVIQSGALELSNVDVATQLVKLIVAQRNFQANAKVISTSDQVTQAVINIR